MYKMVARLVNALADLVLTSFKSDAVVGSVL